MDDLISRREAIKMFSYKDDGTRIPEYDCDNWPVDIHIKDVKNMLRKLPSAQIEIIRCKECKHRPEIRLGCEECYDGFDIEFPDYICPCQCDDGWYNWMPKDDFYCARAERETDG